MKAWFHQKWGRLFLPFFLALIGFFITSFIVQQRFAYNFTGTPDQAINFRYSEIFRDTNQLKYREELNEKYNTYAFGIRGSYYTSDRFLTHGSFHGFIIYLGLLRKISDGLLPFANPLLNFFSVFFFFQISRFFFSERKSVFTTLLFLSSAPFLFYGTSFLHTPGIILCFLGMFFFFLRWIQSSPSKKKDMYFLGWIVFFWLGFWIRIDFLFPTLLLITLFFREVWENRKLLSRKTIFVSLIFSGVFLSLYLFVSNASYGSPFGYFSPGTSLSFSPKIVQNSQTPLEKIVGFFFSSNLIVLLENLRQNLLFISPILSIFFISSFFIRKKNRILFRCSILFLGTVFFYFSHPWSSYGMEKITLSGAPLRYIMVVWCLFILIATDTLWKVIPKKIFAEGIIILICVIHFCLAWFSYMGIEYQIWLKDWTQNVVQKRALETPEDAIFLTSQYDKFIFPYRKTYIYTSLAKDDDRYCRVPHELLQDGYDLYIETTGKEYETFLKQCNLKIDTDWPKVFEKIILPPS